VKLHDLRPAAGSRKARTRVGRGIAAGQGKTAGRGTKGQKARAGASIPAWFEGGQTPIHIRVPKLRGFRNPFKTQYQVVNIGRIAEYAAAGRFGVEVEPTGASTSSRKAKKAAPLSVNPASLASAGLIGTDNKPVKILGQGDVDQPLFIAADAFTASARSKIEAAGGFVQLLAGDSEVQPVVAISRSTTAAKAPPAAEAAPATEATPTAEALAEPTAPEVETESAAEALAEPTAPEAEPAPVAESAAEPTAPEAEPATDAAASVEAEAADEKPRRASRRRKATELTDEE
jgi:large subunit ribosomal protein L15